MVVTSSRSGWAILRTHRRFVMWHTISRGRVWKDVTPAFLAHRNIVLYPGSPAYYIASGNDAYISAAVLYEGGASIPLHYADYVLSTVNIGLSWTLAKLPASNVSFYSVPINIFFNGTDGWLFMDVYGNEADSLLEARDLYRTRDDRSWTLVSRVRPVVP